MNERGVAPPTSKDQGQGPPPKAGGPANANRPPEREDAKESPSPETSTDVHGDPETPV